MSEQLSALRQQALELGIDISTPAKQNAIEERRQNARQIAHAGQGAVKNDQGVYFHLERGIVALGNVLTLLLMLLLANIALPVGLVGLAIVEMQRVEAGVKLFDEHHATLMAIVSVSFYLVLLVVQAHMLLTSTGTQEKNIWSLRLWWRGMAYKLGTGRWQVQTTNPLDRLEAAIGAVGWVIIILGTAGSMAGKLDTVGGAWYEALYQIFMQSSLTDFLAYVGGFVFTAALLAATHWGVGYAYERYARLRPDVAKQDTTNAENEAELLYLQSIIAQAQAKQDAKRKAAQAPKEIEAEQAQGPFGDTRLTMADLEHMPTMHTSNGHTGNGNGKHG
jgi:hypothetical protein